MATLIVFQDIVWSPDKSRGGHTMCILQWLRGFERLGHRVSGSAGEFSCAKGVYAGTRCGWFSDRSACYLAAGRPMVVQSTGFEDLLPTGAGLFAVSSAEEAADAIGEIRANYAHHSDAGRRIAEEHFDSDEVVRGVLDYAGIP